MGVYFVSTGSYSRSPELVMPAIAQTLGIKENRAGQAPLNLLKVFLLDKHLAAIAR